MGGRNRGFFYIKRKKKPSILVCWWVLEKNSAFIHLIPEHPSFSLFSLFFSSLPSLCIGIAIGLEVLVNGNAIKYRNQQSRFRLRKYEENIVINNTFTYQMQLTQILYMYPVILITKVNHSITTEEIGFFLIRIIIERIWQLTPMYNTHAIL